MSSALSSFLSRNSVNSADDFPVIHSTRSYNLKLILGDGEIVPQECDVLTGEFLNYFFVGRPAYKYQVDNSTPEHWEMPCCFVFESEAIGVVKRAFPFDSGAFTAGRYPSYISDIPLKEFETTDSQASRKIIGSFFGTTKRYFNLKPKNRDEFEQEYSLDVFDAEVLAAFRLSGEGTSTKFDDRRFTIELQTENAVALHASNPIAVILPEPYLSVPKVLTKIKDEWNAEPIGYPTFSLNIDCFHSLIYKEVRDLYIRRGFL